ncbi:MAG: aspartate kinase [Clostridiales Family XIII bacterium]|jgi:aspartate kinase|nr:aspartate kinase [Clostridiales Family XIII bacterium]
MGVITAKFGGSSVADAKQIRKTKEIVLSNSERHYIIVSGPGKRFKEDEKITDLLYEYQKLTIEKGNQNDKSKIFSIISERFIRLKKELNIYIDIESSLEKIVSDLAAGANADYAASRGEFLNAKLIAAFYGYDFIDAAGLILFSADGTFLAEETNDVLKKTLAKHERAVIPGFYGTLPNGSIKTFSRGGSDITGAVVARASNSDIYENWTDVSGFLMADPRIVENPRPISVISYREQRELSFMGASVFHEDAITPARLAGIPINIKNTNSPTDAGTMIVADDTNAAKIKMQVKGISGKKNYTSLHIYKNEIGGGASLLPSIFTILHNHNIMPDFTLTTVDAAAIYFAKKIDKTMINIISKDIDSKINAEEISIKENLSFIGIVGDNIGGNPIIAEKITIALKENGIELYGAAFAVSKTTILISIADKDYEKAIRAIYSKLVKE